MSADRAAERERSGPPWQRLDQFPIPLLMMYGTEDRPETRRRLASFQQRYPTLDLRVIERCGHLVHWDAAADFVAAAESFFGGRTAARRGESKPDEPRIQ